MSVAVNATVKAHLQKIIEDERARTIRWMSMVRFVGVALYLLSLVALEDELVFFFVIYTAVAGALVFVARVRKAVRWSAYLPGVLDLPTITAAALLSVVGELTPMMVVNAWLPFVATVVLASTLTMSHRAISVTTLSALACCVVFLVPLNVPAVLPMVLIVGIGGVAAALVSRLRALVEASRRRDFAGQYVLGRRIGVGGMAEVFEATYSPEPGFERLVAVKRVLPGYSSNRNFLSLFRREAAIGAQLAHPNLVQVLDFGRHLDAWFLAMEYVDGVSLAGLLRGSSRPLPVAAALFVVAEVAEGLTYLHERVTGDAPTGGIVHRDVNPPNVLLSMRGEVKLNDFGVARWAAVSDLTVPGARPGKMGYLPPEPQVGPALDLFALGVTAWETLACARLFGGGSEEQVRARIATEPAPSIRGLRPDVPEEVEQLINALLDKDPSRRPSARAVVLALRALEGEAAPYPNGRPALIRALATMEPG